VLTIIFQLMSYINNVVLKQIELEEKEREKAKKGLERKNKFETLSGIEVKQFYKPEDIKNLNYERDLGDPGHYPFTRGIYETMYRGRLWTIRMFSGFGSPRETNSRWKDLIAHGETGLSCAFDYPTLLGYDSDDPLARGEVGRCGVSVSCIKDMEDLWSGIPIGKVTVNYTINTPAIYILACHFALAEAQGYYLTDVSGTTQNDMLKEFIGQKSYRFPPEPHVNIVIDIIKFCVKNAPRWHPVSVSGYHIREAGATPIQELAWTIADGITYIEKCIEAGLNIDDVAPTFSFFFACGDNFFEEIAKFRAARRIWAKIMRERFNAIKTKSWTLRFHTQTAGHTLTYQYPELNIVRVAIQALAAVLGGTQSLHTNSFDEAICVPTEKAARIATLTQRIIAHETGVADVIDPLGGSYYVEWLTNEMEEKAWSEIERIERMGGVIECIKNGYFLIEIAKSANEYRRKMERGEIEKVGVNILQPAELKYDFKPLKVPLELEDERRKFLNEFRGNRDQQKVNYILDKLRKAAEKNDHLFPVVLEAVKAKATLGEVMYVFEGVYGRYREPTIF